MGSNGLQMRSHSLQRICVIARSRRGLARAQEAAQKSLHKLYGSPARKRSPRQVPQMNFASDNTAPVAPAILDALAEASRGYARGYGNDDWTQGAERRFCRQGVCRRAGGHQETRNVTLENLAGASFA